MQKIVDATWRLNSNDISQLSRWIRCLFSLALTSAPKLAEHLLSQVIDIATGAKTVSWIFRFPTKHCPHAVHGLMRMFLDT